MRGLGGAFICSVGRAAREACHLVFHVEQDDEEIVGQRRRVAR